MPLSITIPAGEVWDELTGEFTEIKKPVKLQLEHSLISVSKWESKYHKPFIGNSRTPPKTNAELVNYIKCMTITPNVDEDVYKLLTPEIIKKVSDYINNPMTATTITKTNNKVDLSIITSEIIYYWMTQFNIPFECEKWHLNRLIMLIQVCGEKSQPPKKMPKGKAISNRKALNAARRKQYNTHG